MSQPNTIKIDNVEYVRKTDTPAGPPTPYRIVVADRGWVFVGATTQHPDWSLTIANARVIRVWGTDSKKPGLGYLALNGPTASTKLDPSGTVRVPAHAVVATFDTDSAKWV